MATAYKKCRVCGKQYEYCKTYRRATLFRWQDVACCPEHGAIYFEQIAESRGEKPSSVAIHDFSEDEEFDSLFEEDFDDDDEDLEVEK